MQRYLHKALLISALFITACNMQSGTDYSKLYQRAGEPWVFRSVLDGQARMLTIALHDKLWVAYSAQTGALYKAWTGGVNFDGAVYTTAHGPQPSSLGDAYLVNAIEKPWTVQRGSQEEQPTVRYRGHRFEKGQVSIQTEITLADGTVVKVRERPEHIHHESGQTGFERVFTVENLPADATLKFKTNFSSIAVANSIQTDGTWAAEEVTPRDAKGLACVDVLGQLTLNNKGNTRLAAYFVRHPLIANANQIIEEDLRSPGERLISRSDCKTCHNAYVQTVGPSYLDIAKKYRNTDDNRIMLAAKVKNGGAGVWGAAAMTAHPDLDDADINAMIGYIMGLDAEDEAKMEAIPEAEFGPDTKFVQGDASVKEEALLPGASLKVFLSAKNIRQMADVNFNAAPAFTGIVPALHAEAADMVGLEENFAFLATGYLRIPKSNNYTFRLISDDGSKLFIDGVEVINHDGEHGSEPMDGEILLKEGLHPFRMEYFQSKGGKFISLQWRSFDTKQFEIVPPTILAHKRDEQVSSGGALPMASDNRIPGDAYPVDGVHPAYDLTQARPADFSPKVGGLDFLPDGRLVVSTWDAEGGIYIVDGVQTGDPAKMSYKKIAAGLAEPLGLKVVDGEIYVLQKQELTKLIDHDGDEIIDEYYTVSNDWLVSDNFHEFAFGLAYKDNHFYAALAIAILPGGASANPQIPDRGKAVRIHKETGKLEIVAEGLRTPNGVGIGVDGEVFIADNQGDWLPSSKILHVSKGAFFGSRAVDSARVAQLPIKLPVVWLPQDEIGNSPSTPLAINDGPYKGQMIHGEVTHGGVKRVFVEKVNGEYQGALFRFIQGLEAGVNRMVWGPDGALYVGGIGSSGNWRHEGKLWYGLQRLQYNGQSAFEMLAIRARSNGIEIEFTEPLEPGTGWDVAEYNIQQWRYQPTADYGGPKLDLQKMRPLSANVSQDRKKVFLELDGMKPNHVVYARLPTHWSSAMGHEMWATEAWYTMNQIPQGQPGTRTTAPAPAVPNTLSAAEKDAGWQLLFDGQSTKGWRNFRKKTIGSSWKVVDGTLTLDAVRKDGQWQAEDGGDIITDGTYENYELRIDWKISACGNSGIIYNVVESDDYDYVWQTGPEMQILDNTCHPDAKIETHRAGDLYDMIACKYPTVRPAGQWNQARLVVKDGKTEHWLNGRKVVTFEMFTNEWTQMIAKSKFREMPSFGKSRKGHISLQDHGDPVWFRNIKIRKL